MIVELADLGNDLEMIQNYRSNTTDDHLILHYAFTIWVKKFQKQFFDRKISTKVTRQKL